MKSIGLQMECSCQERILASLDCKAITISHCPAADEEQRGEEKMNKYVQFDTAPRSDIGAQWDYVTRFELRRSLEKLRRGGRAELIGWKEGFYEPGGGEMAIAVAIPPDKVQ